MSDKERLEMIKGIQKRIKACQEKGRNVSNLHSDYVDWLIEQAEKAEKYREALEEITKVDLSDRKSREHYQTEAVYMKITALKALEESK